MNDNILVFDIGYNHGSFTKEILTHFKGVTVIGVDGHPMYEEAFNRSPLPGVTFIHGLVSDKCTKDLSFFICDINPGINSINPEWINTVRHNHFFEKTKREIKVRSTTLDKLISVYGVPDIIKLDIEGAESMALRGLTQKCGTVILEWSEEFFHETLVCVDLLKNLGYSLFACDNHWEGIPADAEYKPDLNYVSWEELNLNNDIIPSRKLRWGMLYAK